MKIKHFSKIWKSAFVILITGIGFNLTSCSHKQDHSLEDSKNLLVNFYDNETKSINEWNSYSFSPFNKHNNILVLRDFAERTREEYNPINFDYYISHNCINLMDLSLNWFITGNFQLTGDAQKDYNNLKNDPLRLFNDFQDLQKKYNQLLTQFAKIGYFNHGFFYEKINISFGKFNTFTQNSNIAHSGNFFYPITFYYDYRNNKILNTKSVLDNLNLAQMKLYEVEK